MLSEEAAEALVGGSDEPLETSDYDFCEERDPLNTPVSFPDQVYKQFVPQGGLPTPILLDEYDPPTPWAPAGYPIVVMVHGGGWWRGCRINFQDVAWEAANGIGLPRKFIALSIDYRLACNSGDPQPSGIPDPPPMRVALSTIDPVPQTKGAAIHDVQDAVTWARTTWPTLPGRPPWNGKMALLGGSAGGTLVYNALAPPPGVGGAVAAGPITSYSDKETLPASFFANGGGPYQGPGGQDFPEAISLQSMVDFKNWLSFNSWIRNTDFLDCIVDQPSHASALRTRFCNDDLTKTVWYRTVAFWGLAVGP